MPAASDREIPQGRRARPIELTRSVLYLPASNPRAIEKARDLNADAVILDLEDAVAPDAKAGARQAAVSQHLARLRGCVVHVVKDARRDPLQPSAGGVRASQQEDRSSRCC